MELKWNQVKFIALLLLTDAIKRSTLVIIMLTCVSMTMAWDFSILHSKINYPNGIILLSNGDILILSVGVDPQYSTRLIRISSEGNFVSSNDYSNYFNTNNFIGGVLELVDDTIYLGGWLLDSNVINTAFIKMDQSLNALRDTFFSDYNFGPQQMWKMNSNQLLLAGYFWESGASISYRSYWIINKEFRLIKEYTDSLRRSDSYNLGNSQFNEFEKKLYVCSVNEVVCYSLPNFNVDDTLHDPNYIMRGVPKITNDGKVLIPCIYREPWPVWGGYHDLCILLTDSSTQILDSFIFHDDVEYNLGYLQPLEINGHQYYLGSTGNEIDGYNIGDTSIFTSFHLVKLDQNLNQIWEKSYDSSSYYKLFSVNVTPDNGILLTGQKWDWTNGMKNKDSIALFILKVDSNGTPTGSTEHAFNKLNVNVFPNPSTSVFNIGISGKNGKTFDIEVVDMQGNMIYQNSIYKNLYIDASKWSFGQYVIRFISETDLYYRKIVKM